MMTILRPLINTFCSSWHLVLFWGIVFAVFTQFLQLGLLILRFGDLPNYVISYDWISHLLLIIRSTPAVGDMLPIIFEEWWIEVGFMNYDFGNGISEWSLNVIPSRLIMLTFIGGMITLLVLLKRGATCARPTAATASVTAGLGTVLMCMTSAAMSWVVCCATPSWVVGLAMLGLGVSTSLALESLGPTLFISGVVLLAVSLIVTSWARSKSTVNHAADCESHEPGLARQYPTSLRRA